MQVPNHVHQVDQLFVLHDRFPQSGNAYKYAVTVIHNVSRYNREDSLISEDLRDFLVVEMLTSMSLQLFMLPVVTRRKIQTKKLWLCHIFTNGSVVMGLNNTDLSLPCIQEPLANF